MVTGVLFGLWDRSIFVGSRCCINLCDYADRWRIQTLKMKTMRERLLASSMICGAAFMALSASNAFAAESTTEVTEVVVTGSRIVRQDYVSTSPIATVTGEATRANGDISLDTYLNTLPQVNPAGTTSSNNPGNGGRSNVDLRGLGPNRNLVLVDGRRPMVSSNSLTVDLNTIPQALIENIEVITGGAGATYGADAVAGVVNLKLKKNFEGVDIRANYSNSTEFRDAEEYQFSLAVGGNFADGKGNAVFALDRAVRQSISKGQRDFSAYATATTSTPPQGAVRWGTPGVAAGAGNVIPLAAIQALFGTAAYGSVAPGAITSTSASLGTNKDGSLIYYGLGNDPVRQVANFRDPIDVTVNKRFYPDFYSYNFDAPNLLILPLDRYSFMFKTNYQLDNGIEVFASAGWTNYTAATALAPSPLPTVATTSVGSNTSRQVASANVTPGATACPSAAGPNTVICNVGNVLVVPVTNPFLPNDLKTLLAARTGDDARLIGSGATEAFLYTFRPVSVGPRLNQNENTIVQFQGGVKVPVGDKFKIEAYAQRGTTTISLSQIGNVDTQRLQNVLEAAGQNPGGSNGACATQNFFGNIALQPTCRAYILSNGAARTSMEQNVAQAFISGPAFTLPAGDVPVVLGVEYRAFDYSFGFLSNPGPFSGFNVQDPEAGNNEFRDVFGETLIPILKDVEYAKSLELGLGFRYSESQFNNKINGVKSATRGNWTYKADVNWEPLDFARVRVSYQRAVREPNFGELFAGGGSAPQVFDPCSPFSKAWTANASTAAGTLRGLCIAQGVSAVNGANTPPGSQTSINTDGNTALNPEKANTFTAGVVLSSPWDNQWLQRLRGTVDYYNIEIKDPILGIDTNNALAACYNYFGTNPTYSNSYRYCSGIARVGGSLAGGNVLDSTKANGNFGGFNGGVQKTTGIDFQVDYGFDTEWLGAPAWMGSIQANLLLTHVMTFEQQDAKDLPKIDFAGTISYFGAGLGTSFPDWKGTLNVRWNLGELPFGSVSAGVRARYISSMTNRQFKQFPGETFLGTAGVSPNVPSVTYYDLDASWAITDNVEWKVGVNNAADKQPPLYAPNVQSGTDPSSYDTVGRRWFSQIKLRF